MAPDFSRAGKIRFGSNHGPMAAAVALVLGSLLVFQTISCGGGSSGMQNPPPPPPPLSTFTTVDAPGAGGTTPEGTFGIGIDANGDIVGYFIDSNNALHGFLRDSTGAEFSVDAPGAGTQQDLGTEAADINASGEIVGFFYDTQGVEHSFVLSAGGTFTVFDPAGATGSGAGCINDSGTVAGGFLDIGGAHGFVRAADGTFTTFDPTGDATQVRIVVPTEINASGAVAGTYTDSNTVFHGFLRDPNGGLTILDAPGAGTAADTGTELIGMNASGTIVGGINVGVVNGVNTTHSLVRAADGTYTVFDPPQSGAHSSFAEAINDSGVVVGTYRDANLVRHGYFLEPDGTFVSFDDPDAAQVPLSDTNQGTVPRRINAGGTVVGFYSDASGVRHAFILQ